MPRGPCSRRTSCPGVNERLSAPVASVSGNVTTAPPQDVLTASTVPGSCASVPPRDPRTCRLFNAAGVAGR